MTDDHEVWLLSWLPGQRTALHDHGGATGAFTVVLGALTERVVGTAEGGRTVEVLHPLAAGQSRAFGPHYVHQVSNEGADPAVSIHVYRPSRAAMTSYRLDPSLGLVRL
jgi:predicted metal-dependent enzyme (double-stranded beta helix superfamily)